MSSDDQRISTEDLLALAEPVHVDTLTRWEGDPYAGDVGQRALQSETFGQLDVVYTYGTEVLYGQDLVEAQRHQPDDDGFVPAVDLAKAGYSRIKAEAAADAKWAIHRDSSVDSVLLAEMRTRIIQEDEAIALAVGYDGDDLDALIEQIEQDQHNVGLNDPDEVPEAPTTEPVTKTGDVWLLGPHRLVCGDCTDVELDGTASAIVTDPPYGQGQPGVPGDDPNNLPAVVKSLATTATASDATAIVFQSPRTFTAALDEMRTEGWRFERLLWMYKQAQMTFPWRGWLLTSEAILSFSRGKGSWVDHHPYSHDCYLLSEVSGELDESVGWHGSVKPNSVLQDIVQRVSREGEVVADPFCGSGSTLIACEQAGRVCHAIELSPHYCDVIAERFERHTGVKPILEATGEPVSFMDAAA